MPLTVLYDDSCPLCRASARRLRRLDRRGDWAFVDSSAPGLVDRVAFERPVGEIRSALHVVQDDGRVLSGFDAVRRLLALNPWTSIPALLLHLPGAAPLGRRAYAVLARNRHRVWGRGGGARDGRRASIGRRP